VLTQTQQIFNQTKLSTKLSRTELKQTKLKQMQSMKHNKLRNIQGRHKTHNYFSLIEFIKWRGTHRKYSMTTSHLAHRTFNQAFLGYLPLVPQDVESLFHRIHDGYADWTQCCPTGRS